MKKLFRFVLPILFILASSGLYAQTTVMRPAVAFVKTGRDTLFIKQPDSVVQAYYLPAIIANIGGINSNIGVLQVFDSINHLAIIGMTSSGDRIVLGGTVGYLNQSSGGHDVFQGIFSVPWPPNATSFQRNFEFLLAARAGLPNFRPSGVVSKDGTQWWAIMASSSLGDDSATFYHGNSDGTGLIDSTTDPTLLESGVQFSNIAVDSKGGTMLAMACDALTAASQETGAHVYFYKWDAGQGNSVQATDLQATLKSFGQNSGHSIEIDSVFGLTVVPQNDGSNVMLGFCTDQNRDNTIQLYSVNYAGATLNFSSPINAIPRSAIPSNQDFFAGGNCGPYLEEIAAPTNSQCGNSGDVSVNAMGGDSILFTTHESPYNCGPLRNTNSAVWYYDISTDPNNAVLVYNDASAQELQPVWVVTPYIIPAAPKYPGIAWQGTSGTSNFGTVDTSSDSVMTFTVKDTSQVSTTIDSAHVGGANASEMTLGALTYPITLQPQGTQNFVVTFKPIAPNGSRKAALKVYFEGQTHDSLTEMLSGTANVPLNGVANDPTLSSSMTIEPNPFSTSTSVQLTVPSVGALGIVVHDALGRLVYTSDTREVGAGQTESFQFDAKSLGLPDGVYYVTAFLGERQASRAVVFVH